jgi:hypothetical protein
MRYTLLTLLYFFPIVVFGQRYAVSPQEGKKGILIFAGMVAVVLLITLVLYLKKKDR